MPITTLMPPASNNGALYGDANGLFSRPSQVKAAIEGDHFLAELLIHAAFGDLGPQGSRNHLMEIEPVPGGFKVEFEREFPIQPAQRASVLVGPDLKPLVQPEATKPGEPHLPPKSEASAPESLEQQVLAQRIEKNKAEILQAAFPQGAPLGAVLKIGTPTALNDRTFAVTVFAKRSVGNQPSLPVASSNLRIGSHAQILDVEVPIPDRSKMPMSSLNEPPEVPELEYLANPGAKHLAMYIAQKTEFELQLYGAAYGSIPRGKPEVVSVRQIDNTTFVVKLVTRLEPGGPATNASEVRVGTDRKIIKAEAKWTEEAPLPEQPGMTAGLMAQALAGPKT